MPPQRPEGSDHWCSAAGVSDDGSHIVGTAQAFVNGGWTEQGFVWIEGATAGVVGNPKMFQLAPEGTNTMSQAADISGDRRFVAGTSFGNGGRHATRWSIAAWPPSPST